MEFYDYRSKQCYRQAQPGINSRGKQRGRDCHTDQAVHVFAAETDRKKRRVEFRKHKKGASMSRIYEEQEQYNGRESDRESVGDEKEQLIYTTQAQTTASRRPAPSFEIAVLQCRSVWKNFYVILLRQTNSIC